MKRVLIVTLILAGSLAGVIVASGWSWPWSDEGNRYTVVLDNAFGLIEGADVKVAGVRAGSIESFKVDPESYRARVGIKVNRQGFSELREDVFCESRPQSLIGEYFLDCKPGTSRTKLKQGAVIPVSRTGSTIPVDLVNNIMRRPFRERFSILLGELGAAFASRGEDLNETIRRANPALRETDRVLAILARERTVIRDLTTNADRVVTRLARDKTEVTRFVAEARDTARTTAQRREALRGQVQRFPEFLDELEPTMARLGEAADAQVPALRNLSEQAPLLERFFDDLGPFAEASRPAFRTLAGASRAGRAAVKVSRPRITELRAFAADLPEVAGNLAIVLEHLHDRKFATEKDPRSPGGEGFTGFEAILQYVFRQSQAVNTFDSNSYLLKVSAFLDNICAQYTTAEQAKTPERRRCRANLGPNQPGITSPDPTKGSARRATVARRSSGSGRERTAPASAGDAPARTPSAPSSSRPAQQPAATPAPAVPGAPAPAAPNSSSDPGLLDFLFGP